MPAPPSRASLASVATRSRQAVLKLHERIIRGLGPEVDPIFNEAAIVLGLLQREELLAESPHELAVIADFALYDVHRDGRNAIERYRDVRRPSTKSHEGALLAALTAARCSAFRVDSVEPGVGMAVTDLFGGPARFVVDPGVSTIASEGVCFVARLVTVDGATITTGPALPLDEEAQDEVNDDLIRVLPGRDLARLIDLSPAESAQLSVVLWNAALDATSWAIDDYLAAMPEDEDEDEDDEAPAMTIVRAGADDGDRSPAGESVNYAAAAPTYQRLRGTVIDLQQRVVDTLTDEEIADAANRLGVARRGGLAAVSDHEYTVVMDFAIHDLRRGGRTSVERYLAKRADALSADERLVLEAMTAQRYTILMIEGAEPGAGAHCTDLLGGPPVFLYDIGLSQTAKPGLLLAARLIAPANLTMTTGAATPFARVPNDDRQASVIESFERGPFAALGRLDAGRAAEVAAAVIRVALENAGNITIMTNDPTNPDRPFDPQPPGTSS